MPRRKTKRRTAGISKREIEQLREAIVEGWPWRLHEDDRFREVPLNNKLTIILSHLTKIFTRPCGSPGDPHPSDDTIAWLYQELGPELIKSEKQWGHLVPKKHRWHSNDLRDQNPSWGLREVY